ncbi:hypothetical protein GCM10027280_45190 [Micromonospora polyrhachis]|uniref:Uncharacterized protein n=1 Tax=Micromonospora polyrhachis TaxID=1282883 RepID=A0A7W7WPZ9_9ACTN|nr:hypothetical protein [Micromonospora polyrhachis]MBB4958967.1 hypothetical protein [Micromonospora polyrhachis]
MDKVLVAITLVKDLFNGGDYDPAETHWRNARKRAAEAVNAAVIAGASVWDMALESGIHPQTLLNMVSDPAARERELVKEYRRIMKDALFIEADMRKLSGDLLKTAGDTPEARKEIATRLKLQAHEMDHLVEPVL